MFTNKGSRMVAIDFFCGAGGVTCGLLKSGIDVIAGIDLDNSVEQGYLVNNKTLDGTQIDFFNIDVNHMEYSVLERVLKKYSYDSLLFVACAPCQPFTKLSTIRDKRVKDKQCLLRFGEFVHKFRPDYVLVENVPGIDAEKYGGILNTFKEDIKGCEYYIIDRDINAKYYGVPQNRVRRILLASKHGPIEFPPFSNGDGLQDFETVRDCFTKHRLPPIKAGEFCECDPIHRAANLSEKNMYRIMNTQHDGGVRVNWMKTAPLKCYLDHKKNYTDVYGRLFWDKPAPTITTKFISLSNGRFGHPDQNRALSLREGALLQTFPPDYKFFGSMVTIAKHIGNAVPVRLAEVFGLYILEMEAKRRLCSEE